MGLDAVPLRLRLIRVELETGEIEVLIKGVEIDGYILV
jgi:hypothetical protein